MARITCVTCCAAMLAFSGWAQQSTDQSAPRDQPQVEQQKHKGPGAAKDIGGGAGDVGKGAAKGAGDAAKGVGKGAGDLVTLHPINAAGAVGKGAVSTGKDVTGRHRQRHRQGRPRRRQSLQENLLERASYCVADSPLSCVATVTNVLVRFKCIS